MEVHEPAGLPELRAAPISNLRTVLLLIPVRTDRNQLVMTPQTNVPVNPEIATLPAYAGRL
jgi:hypothetical protein